MSSGTFGSGYLLPLLDKRFRGHGVVYGVCVSRAITRAIPYSKELAYAFLHFRAFPFKKFKQEKTAHSGRFSCWLIYLTFSFFWGLGCGIVSRIIGQFLVHILDLFVILFCHLSLFSSIVTVQWGTYRGSLQDSDILVRQLAEHR